MSSLTSASWLVWVLTLPGVDKAPDVRFEPYYPDTARQTEQAPTPAPAPPSTTTTTTEKPGREFFFSWGYNGNSYGNRDLHITQSSLGNDFTFVDVRIRDSKGWTDLFNHSLFVPQYNVRFG